MNAPVEVEIMRLEHGADLPLPAYASAGSAGMDLRAAIHDPEVLAPGERRLIATGISIALPPGHEAQVRPRSGLAVRYGLTCLNAPGTIDSDYRGEIKVILINHARQPATVRRGERIAQLVIAPVCRAAWRLTDRLRTTERGAGGFGSSGVA